VLLGVDYFSPPTSRLLEEVFAVRDRLDWRSSSIASRSGAARAPRGTSVRPAAHLVGLDSIGTPESLTELQPMPRSSLRARAADSFPRLLSGNRSARLVEHVSPTLKKYIRDRHGPGGARQGRDPPRGRGTACSSKRRTVARALSSVRSSTPNAEEAVKTYERDHHRRPATTA